MIGSRPAEILRQLETPSATDRELIERFARFRDQPAFSELVRRHGPVVLGVCKRVLGHEQDAEDAFQAVFLILARKASAIGKPELLGNWLHGVAVRVAKTLRRSIHRRRVHEVLPAVMPEPMTSHDTMVPEWSQFLDQELAALPSWYREAIVLCDLQGIAREEAASRLGVPAGTLSSRLANGRKKLAERLTRLGITLSIAAVPAALAQAQVVNVSTELIARTCSLVADWAAGATIPKPLAKLSGRGTTMWKLGAAMLLIATLALAGVVSAFHTPENPLPEKQQPVPAPVPAVKTVVTEQAVPIDKPGDNELAFTNAPRLRDTLDLKLDASHTVGLHWNAQGDRISFVGHSFSGNKPEVVDTPMLLVAPLAHPGRNEFVNSELASMPLVERVMHRYQSFVGFTPDGKQVLTEHREYSLFSGEHKLYFWENVLGNPRVLNEVKSLHLPSTESRGYFPSADGKTYRTLGIERDPKTETVARASVMEIDAATGQRVKTLMTTEPGLFSKIFGGRGVLNQPSSVEPALFAMSPDWKRLAVLGRENTVVMYDVDRAVRTFIYKVPSEVKKNVVAVRESGLYSTGNRDETSRYRPFVTFSPDGHRLLISCTRTAYRQYPLEDGSQITAITSDGLGQCLVLNADNGKPLPALEGAESLDCVPQTNAFSTDGRLLVLSGKRMSLSRQKLIVSGPGKKGKDEPEVQPREQVIIDHTKPFLTIWDTQTGRIVKSWDMEFQVAFNPVRLLLAVVESNGVQLARVGLWDFSAEMADKK